MADLVTFLAARLDEDEAAARDAYYERQRWITEEEGVYRWPEDERYPLVQMADRKKDARHIARWDPARVLREVAAKRSILARYEGSFGERRAHPDDMGLAGALLALHGSVRALAAVYSDHPDYDPAWA